MDIKVAIIGAGNIGGATAIGLATHSAAKVAVTTAHRESLKRFEGYDIETLSSNSQAVKGADIIIIAVKPENFRSVVEEIVTDIDPCRHIVVCMAPGIDPETLTLSFPQDTSLAYIIPNTAIEVGESMTFIAPVIISEPQLRVLSDLFSKVGQTAVIDAKRLHSGVSIASCGIAYALEYIKAASQGGVALGFSQEQAERIVAQTVRGATAVLEAHKSTPQEEIDKVTTPGGMTIRGLGKMEENGFTGAVIRGLV